MENIKAKGELFTLSWFENLVIIYFHPKKKEQSRLSF